MKRQPVVGLSLKLYHYQMEANIQRGQELAKALSNSPVELIYFPHVGAISQVAEALSGTPIGLGSQNIAPVASGAFTGEYSILSLKEAGGKYVEIGHSERRRRFKEDDEMIRQKVRLTLAEGLIPLLCLGEEQKLADPLARSEVLERQLFLALQGLKSEQISQVIIAYEPVWAIGQSVAAAAPYVHESHQLIRQLLAKHFGFPVSQVVRIIYGGSVSQENAEFITAHPDVDGVFVGRFGHQIERLQAIVTTVANKDKTLRK